MADTLTLERARNLLKISQNDLALEAGVKKSAISDIEQGRVAPENVAYGTITRIVRALQRLGLSGVTADDLFPVLELAA